MMNSVSRKTVAVDFDGVIHRYSRGWQDGSCYDEPMPGTRVALDALANQYTVVVFTARDDLDAVWAWLEQHGLEHFVRDVTNKKPMAWLYIDDRGLRFRNWESAIQYVALLAGNEFARTREESADA